MLKRAIGCVMAIGLLMPFACGTRTAVTVETQSATPVTLAVETPVPEPETPAIDEVALATNTPEPTKKPMPTPTEEPTPAPTEEPSSEPTPEPTPVRVTIGVVGDIMTPPRVVADAKAGGRYDFSAMFAPFQEVFESVDLMCGNLETTLAGDRVGYSMRKDEATGVRSFNAPDALIDALKAYGFDLLSTANNHCMDNGAKGLYRTVEVIRAAGLYQTGTYLNAEDRENPCVIEINGIKIGFVASTRLLNMAFKDVGREEEHTAIGYLVGSDGEKLSDEVLNDIERVKNAGAEFVILFAHWDYENSNPTASVTKKLAKQLLTAGVDCIVGSHPHRVKGAEYVTVDRKDGPFTGLVLYSLGNFTALEDFEMMVGLFAQLTLTREPETGKVVLENAAVLPTLMLRRNGNGPKYVVVPAYEDAAKITGLRHRLTEKEIREISEARALALKKLGTEANLTVLGGE